MRRSHGLTHTREKYLEGKFMASGLHSKKPTRDFYLAPPLKTSVKLNTKRIDK
jgi:hypothetical protein